MIKTTQLYDLNHTLAGTYLAGFEYPWQALPGICGMIVELGNKLGEEYQEIALGVWVHRTANIAPTAMISSPCIIGAGTVVRHCAFFRGSTLIGNGCVVGNSVELKNAILFDGAQVPHFNYVGDSILGYQSHLGAGAVTSNFKLDSGFVTVREGTEMIETGLRKMGAILGDHVEVGCNSVLNPGTVVGRNTIIYPTCCVRGIVPENSILKSNGKIVRKERL